MWTDLRKLAVFYLLCDLALGYLLHSEAAAYSVTSLEDSGSSAPGSSLVSSVCATEVSLAFLDLFVSRLL